MNMCWKGRGMCFRKLAWHCQDWWLLTWKCEMWETNLSHENNYRKFTQIKCDYISSRIIYWVHSVASKLPRKFDRAVLLFPSVLLVLKSSIKHVINVSCEVILVQVTQVRLMLSPFVQGVVTMSWNNTIIPYDVFHTACDKRLCKVPFMSVFTWWLHLLHYCLSSPCGHEWEGIPVKCCSYSLHCFVYNFPSHSG